MKDAAAAEAEVEEVEEGSMVFMNLETGARVDAR
jgi:hypothetical protein